MALREANLLDTRREGRYIFYSLRDKQLLALIHQAGEIAGIPLNEIEALTDRDPDRRSPYPKCTET
jgi:DNA-binding transcriptional ArsR family regulator